MILSFKNKIILFTSFVVLMTSLWVNNIYLLFIFSVLCWILIPHKKWWDSSVIFLLLFSLFYGVMLYMNNRLESGFIFLSYLIAPAAFYRFGRLSMNIFKEENLRQKFLLVIILCYLIYLFLLTFKDIAIVGIVNETRVLLSDLGEEHALAATLYGMMSSIGIGCIASVFIRKQKLRLKLVFLLLSIFSFLVVIHLVNRTGLIVFFTCLLISSIISTKFNIVKMIGMLSILLLIGFILFSSGVIDQEIFDAYLEREQVYAYDASTIGGRKEKWITSMKNLFVYPLGWSDKGGYAHNLWLDIARVGGLFPLFPFLVTTFLYLKSFLRLIRKISSSNFITIIISINIAMFLASVVEPVIEGSLLFFCLLMMIWGITKSLAVEK